MKRSGTLVGRKLFQNKTFTVNTRPSFKIDDQLRIAFEFLNAKNLGRIRYKIRGFRGICLMEESHNLKQQFIAKNKI